MHLCPAHHAYIEVCFILLNKGIQAFNRMYKTELTYRAVKKLSWLRRMFRKGYTEQL